LLDDKPRRTEMVIEGRKLVDGRGASRVAAALGGYFRITVLTAKEGWLAEEIPVFIDEMEKAGHDVCVAFEADDVPCGDVLFLLSFWEVVPANVLRRNTHNVVVHESALPKGRGWSPVAWQVIEGRDEIPMLLIEAETEVDSGPVYLEKTLKLEGSELLSEIRAMQARLTFDLCERFLSFYPQIAAVGRQQDGESSRYRRRFPADSELDPSRPLEQQFDLLRVVDNDRYPAFFWYRGQRYVVKIEKSDQERRTNLSQAKGSGDCQ